MTLLHFLAIQLTELNPTETLYWAHLAISGALFSENDKL